MLDKTLFASLALSHYSPVLCIKLFQNYISQKELKFITVSNESENVGLKRIDRTVPWKDILTSGPVWAALISVVCHEFPLMTMIMFLPSYLHDVHHYEATKNGILSALPTACLWVSKIASSYLNTWLQQKTRLGTTTISRVNPMIAVIMCPLVHAVSGYHSLQVLNGIGSFGLAVFMVAATFLDSTRACLAVVFLCFSMLFTGT